LRAQVFVTEEMGSETVVFLTCGGQRVTVTAPAGFRSSTGEALGVIVPASALHLFNGETGKVLISGEGKE